MAEASGVTIEIDAKSVPLMVLTLELARGGTVTRAAASNLEYLGDRFTAKGVDETLVKVLADAQTSGGLLLAVARDRVDALVTALKKRHTRAAEVIAKIAPKSNNTIVLS